MNSTSLTSPFILSEVCGPIRPLQHNPYIGRTMGGLTQAQLKSIEDQLNQDFRILKIMFHALPAEVHARSPCSRNLTDLLHPLSGNKDSNMYDLFSKSSSSLEETFEKGRRMALAFENVLRSEVFYEKATSGAYMTPTKLKELFSEVTQQFQNNICSLREGDLLIMPSATYSHALAYVVKSKANGICTFSIINTGLGLDILGTSRSSVEQGKAQAPSFDVPQELIPLLIDPILAFTYATRVGKNKDDPQQTRTNFKQALEQFYAKVKRLFSAYPEYKQPHVIQPRGYGICTATCVHAALEIFDPDSLREIQENGILTADRTVKEIHRRALGISRILPRHGNTPKIKELVEGATLCAWRAFGLRTTIVRDSQCIQIRTEDLLDRLNLEAEKAIKESSSVAGGGASAGSGASTSSLLVEPFRAVEAELSSLTNPFDRPAVSSPVTVPGAIASPVSAVGEFGVGDTPPKVPVLEMAE
jgi:hypothetical protein